MASETGIGETVPCIWMLPNVSYVIEYICFKEFSKIFEIVNF